MVLTPEQFRVATGASAEKAQLYFPHAVKAMAGKVDTPVRVAAFLANVAIETAHLQAMEESLYYKDPERVARIFLRVFDTDHNRKISPDEMQRALPYVKNHKGLSMRLYEGYHGRGALQLTWLRNYQLASSSLGFDYVTNPDLVMEPEHCFATAVDYFIRTGGNEACDDFKECVRSINPALMHLSERTAQFDKNIQMLA